MFISPSVIFVFDSFNVLELDLMNLAQVLWFSPACFEDNIKKVSVTEKF